MSEFSIKNLKNIFLIGFHDSFKELVKINKKNKLKTFIITSIDQSKELPSGLNFKIFNNLNINFEKFLKQNINVSETLFISFSSRWIFKKKHINNYFKNNLINFHGSRLPIDSGGGGFSWRILKNDRIGNLLFHLVDDKIDHGPIISYETFLFPTKCKIPKDFYDYQLPKTILFYKNFIYKLKNNEKFNLSSQNNYNRSYFPRLYTKINSWIDWNMNSDNLEKFIDAFDDPYEGAKTRINGILVNIKKVQLHSAETNNHNFLKGLIIRKYEDWILVCTSDHKSLIIQEVLNNKKINILNKLKVGDRFFTKQYDIENSLKSRPYFDQRGIVQNK